MSKFFTVVGPAAPSLFHKSLIYNYLAKLARILHRFPGNQFLEFLVVRHLTVLIAAILVLGSQAASADPIRFEWTNNGSGTTLFSGSGYFLIDDADLILDSFTTNQSASIYEFAFNWSTSAGDFSSSSANGDQIVQRASIGINSALEVLGFDICFSSDGACVARTSAPLIRVTGGFWLGTLNNNNSIGIVDGRQTLTASRVTAVPEPGTLALLGLGLIGVGLARRKKA